MTSRELIRWSTLHERRSRAWWASPLVIALAAGGALAGFVAWRASASAAAASHGWLGGVCVAFAIAFLRVPFHLYWRSDAAFLAQLPIDGTPLLDAALFRCVRAAVATTLATAIGALPLGIDALPRHLAVAAALGVAAAALLPAVAMFAATLVATQLGDKGVKTASAIAGTQPGAPPSAILGALPGLMSSAVIVVVALLAPWLTGGTAAISPGMLGVIAGVGVLGLVWARAASSRVMATILRDVSALDRQRLATLDVQPPTAIERLVASLIGDAALPYRKDARLMRRRYPMAFALGGLAFIVLAIVGIANPDDPVPWIATTLAGTAIYAAALATRLRRPPIELARLSASLPITPAARTRAKTAWLVAWAFVFVLVPAAFAILRVT